MPGGESPDPEYVAARRVLLDALDALGAHRKTVVLVGAQAIYFHVGEGDLAVSPYTTDGDLAIDPRALDDEPALAATLEAAGFALTVRPGTWSMSEVQIDLLVPASLGGPGRRGARLGAHGNEVARKASGLEAAIVDHSLHRIGALDPTDARSLDVAVAGVASLLIAKLHKIAERKDMAERRQDKDGLDVLRLLRFADPGFLTGTLEKLMKHPVAGTASREARTFLGDLFGDPEAPGAPAASSKSTAATSSLNLRRNRLPASPSPHPLHPLGSGTGKPDAVQHASTYFTTTLRDNSPPTSRAGTTGSSERQSRINRVLPHPMLTIDRIDHELGTIRTQHLLAAGLWTQAATHHATP